MIYLQLVGYNDEILDAKFYGESDSHIVVASNSDQIRVFNRLTSACQLLTGHQDTVLSLDTFSDNLTFASASKVSTLHIYIWIVSKKYSFPFLCTDFATFIELKKICKQNAIKFLVNKIILMN